MDILSWKINKGTGITKYIFDDEVPYNFIKPHKIEDPPGNTNPEG
jgi:hypothetical protein